MHVSAVSSVSAPRPVLHSIVQSASFTFSIGQRAILVGARVQNSNRPSWARSTAEIRRGLRGPLLDVSLSTGTRTVCVSLATWSVDKNKSCSACYVLPGSCYDLALSNESTKLGNCIDHCLSEAAKKSIAMYGWRQRISDVYRCIDQDSRADQNFSVA